MAPSLQPQGLTDSRSCSSSPLPPVTRIEDKAQSRKCIRLRKALRGALADVLKTYISVSAVTRGFAEQTDLEKYLDVYEISDFDLSDANREFDTDEFEDAESLRTLKIVSSRLHTMRKLFLCSLLALDASGEKQDLLRWTAAVEALRTVNASIEAACSKLRAVLSEEECKAKIPDLGRASGADQATQHSQHQSR